MTNGDGDQTVLAYNSEAQLVSLTDADGNETTWTYDAAGNVISETNPLGTQTDTYNAANQLTSQTDAIGQERTFAYGVDGSLIQEQWLGSNGQPTETIAYTYNAAGELVSASDGQTTETLSYNSAGQLTGTTESGPGLGGTTIGVAYTGNSAGEITAATLSVNSQVDSTDDYAYDALGRMVTATQSGGSASPEQVGFTYVGNSGEYATVTRSNDLTGASAPAVTGSYQYSPSGQLSGLTYSSGGAVLVSFAWTGDAPASGGSVTASGGSGTSSSGFALADTIANTDTQVASNIVGTFTDGSTTTAYASDGAGQLVGSVDTSGNTTSYSYDPNGNRIGAGYVVGPDNELLADPTHTYTYDADGRMTSAVDTTTGQRTTYSWDARGRLVGASVYAANGSLEESVAYTYDALNQLVRRVVTGPSGNVLSDERYANEVTSLAAPVVTAGTTSQASLDNLAAVIGSDSTVTDRYLYGPGTDQVLAQDSPGAGTQWLLTDNHGTVRAVAATNPTTGQTGVIKQITYDAFANVTSDSNPAVSVRFGYTGRWVDSITGLQTNRARWYDATDGRWISQDPMGFNAGQANLYVYVGNNPTGATDPSGEGVRSWLQDSWVGRRVVNVFDGAAELPCMVRDLA